MFTNFLIGTLCGILFLLMKNIFVYDIFGLDLQFSRPEQIPADVRDTSRLVSGWRAMDSNRANSVYFQLDPLATVLAGSAVASLKEEAAGIFRAPASNELHSVTLRQLALDRRILQHCSTRTEASGENDLTGELPPIRQVVVIGAGMDTRSYRLSLPHVHWFEIDMPEVVSLKEQLLAEHVDSSALRVKQCTRIAFNLKESNTGDLRSVLAAHGHAAAEPTLFLMEGLVMYLSPAEIRALMDSLLPVAAPHSHVLMTQISLKIHYLLTNPLVVFCIEHLTKSKSHQIARLFKSNLYSTDLGPEWRIQTSANIGQEMWKTAGLSQWQLQKHVEGSPPQMVNTAEHILDISRV